LLAIYLIPTPTAIWYSAAMMHSPKGRECEARSNLGSPLGELCIIGFVYGLLRGLATNLVNTNRIENPQGFS